MHELSISQAIVDTAVRHAGGRKVSRVDVRLGALRQVVPDSLRFYFEIVGRDTVCDGSDLELELIDALLRCDCGREWDPAPVATLDGPLIPSFRCPDCGAGGAETLAGDELRVESIEVEETAASHA